MQVHHLLNAYSTKISQVFMQLQDAATDALKGLVNRITTLFNKLVKSLHYQAWTSLAFAGGTGACIIGGARIPNAAPIKPFVEAGGKALPELGRFFGTFQQADSKKYELEQQLYQTHHLQKDQETKRKFDDGKEKIEQTISKLSDLDAQAFASATKV